MRYILTFASSILIISMLSGCGKYKEVEQILNQNAPKTVLAEVQPHSFTTLEQAQDVIYQKQLEACGVYKKICEATYSAQFDYNQFDYVKSAQLCNETRVNLQTDLFNYFAIDMRSILKNISDFNSIDNYINERFKEVLDFSESYSNINNAKDIAYEYCDILLKYANSSNTLAHTFLKKNTNQVTEAATSMISLNAKTDKDFRFYVNRNNRIISAINKVYGDVDTHLSDIITDSTNFLAAKMIAVLDTIDETEKASVLAELGYAEDETQLSKVRKIDERE